MKVPCAVVLTFTLLSSVLGWIGKETVEIDPEYCQSSDPSVGKLKVGVSRLAGRCVKATCTPGLIIYEGCNATGPPPCRFGKEDLSKEHPHCCPQAICS
ncbi:hypothetical protein PPYR_11805 [Photinus pyralis]|uniref:Single domain-containing protein n=1 Tax=Photinus pyralis TaxID=7054 RepID=A0A5N4ACC9_PHOPY|nr:hypothetical protein PPYR_11805 [Photinus pyralis]